MVLKSELIKHVKSRPLLYEKRWTNNVENDDIKGRLEEWRTLAQELKVDVKNAITTWKKLVDDYTVYLSTNKDAKFSYATEMEFMQEHLMSSDPIANAEKDSTLEDTLMSVLKEYEDPKTPPLDIEAVEENIEPMTALAKYHKASRMRALALKKKLEAQQASAKQMKLDENAAATNTTSSDTNASRPFKYPVPSSIALKVATKSTSTTPLRVVTEADIAAHDFQMYASMDLYFLGHSRLMQQMPPALQVRTKRKINKIMEEAELEMLSD